MGIADLDALSSTLAQRMPRIPLVAIAASDSESDVLVSAEMGVTGYVTQESSVDELRRRSREPLPGS